MKIKLQPLHHGFSLFEMLTCICLLAILLTLALPMFANAEGARQATHQKNAQTFCSLASAAQAAGIPLTKGSKDIGKILSQLRDGVTVTRGPLAGRSFKLPNITDEDIQGALDYIRLEGGELIYTVGAGL
jgi:prepilin-type N-terminal cleavage/methylation domain-containing protein